LFRLKNEEAATNLSAVIKENVPTDWFYIQPALLS
jgi:hypothetical protein